MKPKGHDRSAPDIRPQIELIAEKGSNFTAGILVILMFQGHKRAKAGWGAMFGRFAAMPQQAYGVRIDLKKQIGTQQSG
jgi:hypothetical protein